MKEPRKILISALCLNALAWVIALTSDYWAPRFFSGGYLGFGIIFVSAFGFTLAAVVLMLIVGVAQGVTVLRENDEQRTWPNLLLVGLSALDMMAHAYYVKVFFYG